MTSRAAIQPVIMGANISVEGCEARYGIRIDCTPPERGNEGGEYFEFNPDIAGLGVSPLSSVFLV